MVKPFQIYFKSAFSDGTDIAFKNEFSEYKLIPLLVHFSE